MLAATVLLTIVTLASSMTITIASHSLPSFLITIAATFPVQAQFPFHHFYHLYFGMNIAHHAQSQVSDSPPELGHLDRQGEDLPSVLPVAWLNGLGKLKAQESDVSFYVVSYVREVGTKYLELYWARVTLLPLIAHEPPLSFAPV